MVSPKFNKANHAHPCKRAWVGPRCRSVRVGNVRNTMATHTSFVYKSEETKILENLSGAEFDLSTTIDWCQRYNSIFNNVADRQASWMIGPLCTAILVQFIRSFSGGVRKDGVKDIPYLLTKEELERYNYFKHIRDKHIAHSINAMEVHVVSAYYIKEEPEKGVQSIGHAGDRTIGLSAIEINELEVLAEKLLGIVNERIKVEREKILKFAKKIPPEKFAEYSMPKIGSTSDIDVSKRRR